MTHGIKTNKMWAVSTKRSTVLTNSADTKNSIYPVLAYKAFRKFTTRSAARNFKASLKNPQAYCIINTVNSTVVR